MQARCLPCEGVMRRMGTKKRQGMHHAPPTAIEITTLIYKRYEIFLVLQGSHLANNAYLSCLKELDDSVHLLA